MLLECIRCCVNIVYVYQKQTKKRGSFEFKSQRIVGFGEETKSVCVCDNSIQCRYRIRHFKKTVILIFLLTYILF
jgi:hypothetical protein